VSHNIARTPYLGNQMLGMSFGMGYLAAVLTQGLARGLVRLGLRRFLCFVVVVLAAGALCDHLGVGHVHRPIRSQPSCRADAKTACRPPGVTHPTRHPGQSLEGARLRAAHAPIQAVRSSTYSFQKW
jgi:hypothetical protein